MRVPNLLFGLPARPPDERSRPGLDPGFGVPLGGWGGLVQGRTGRPAAPLLADTYALERRFNPLASSESRGNILDSARKERNISFMLMSSFAEHSALLPWNQK